eukprot:8149639-Alexandrium_andersonii.AAC.1
MCIRDSLRQAHLQQRPGLQPSRRGSSIGPTQRWSTAAPSRTDFLIPARPEFNTTNVHFDRVASFVLACQQLQSS